MRAYALTLKGVILPEEIRNTKRGCQLNYLSNKHSSLAMQNIYSQSDEYINRLFDDTTEEWDEDMGIQEVVILERHPQ